MSSNNAIVLNILVRVWLNPVSWSHRHDRQFVVMRHSLCSILARSDLLPRRCPAEARVFPLWVNYHALANHWVLWLVHLRLVHHSSMDDSAPRDISLKISAALTVFRTFLRGPLTPKTKSILVLWHHLLCNLSESRYPSYVACFLLPVPEPSMKLNPAYCPACPSSVASFSGVFSLLQFSTTSCSNCCSF